MSTKKCSHWKEGPGIRKLILPAILGLGLVPWTLPGASPPEDRYLQDRYTDSMEYLQRAEKPLPGCREGDTGSMLELGLLFGEMQSESGKWLNLSARRGNPRAMVILMHDYLRRGPPPNYVSAYAWLRAQWLLGIFKEPVFSSHGYPRDERMDEAWFRERMTAEEMNWSLRQADIILRHLGKEKRSHWKEGPGIRKPILPAALGPGLVPWTLPGASPSEDRYLQDSYAYTLDYLQRAETLLPGCREGDTGSMLELGLLFGKMRCESEKWLKLSAWQGNPKAMVILMSHYLRRGPPPNYVSAYAWLRAQWLLGIFKEPVFSSHGERMDEAWFRERMTAEGMNRSLRQADIILRHLGNRTDGQ